MFIPTTGTSLTAEDTGAKVLRLRTALNDKEMELIELREQHMRVMVRLHPAMGRLDQYELKVYDGVCIEGEGREDRTIIFAEIR